jgi:hypothetical protein
MLSHQIKDLDGTVEGNKRAETIKKHITRFFADKKGKEAEEVEVLREEEEILG